MNIKRIIFIIVSIIGLYSYGFLFGKIVKQSDGTWALFGGRLYLSFEIDTWLVSFWFTSPDTEISYLRGGFGFWKLGLESELFELRLGYER